MPRAGPTMPLVPKEETRRLRSYLPALVLERLATAHGPETPGTEHRFGAATLFADISGFTSMSEALAATGKGGSEEMTELLNDYFGTMVALVDAYGGSVMTFGGDALTAVFPYRGHSVRAIRRAVRCANDMQLEMGRYQMIPTSAGPFSLAFKAGLAAGPVLLTTIGDERLRYEPVIAGSSINGCVAAEHHASAGTIVLHPSIAASVAGVHASSLERGFATVEPVPSRRRPTGVSSLQRLEATAVEASTVRAFMHPSVAAAIESGHGRYLNEHRRVIAVFTTFDGPDPTRRAAGAELQRMLSPALDAVKETGGHLLQVDTGDKGDTFIVLFGAPVAHGDDERRALTFALRLREIFPDVRTGVCCGAMFCGEVGGESRRTYTTIGDPMNVAARLMQRADRGVTLVAGMSDEAVHGTVRVTPVGVFTVKGRSQPVRPLSIAGPTRRPGETRPVGDIVGRRSERERLRRRIVATVRGRGRTVVVAGPAGIGKSRLVEDAIATAMQHGLSVHRDWCRSTTTATPYASIRGLVGSLLGLEDGSMPDERRMRDAVAGIDPGLGPRAPLLGPVLGIAMSDTDVTRGIAGDLRRELLESMMLEIVARRAERGPLMLCVEDCHWLDALSRQLVSALSESVSGMATLVLLTARAASEADPRGRVPTLPTMPHAETMSLPPLDDRDSLRLARATVRRAFGTVPHSESYLDWLVERADGNPFFLEETVHLLRDRDIDPGEPTAVSSAELPTTIHQLVVARLDALPASHRSLLLQASVLGAEFDPSWLWGSFDDVGSPALVRHRLADLRGLDLIERPQTGRRRATRFRHATIREAAYETLSLTHRRDLHHQVGEFLEQAHRDDLETHAEELAHHYGETRDIPKQRTYFAMAARKARTAFLNEAASTWLRQLEPIAEAEDRSAVMRDIGEIEQLVGSWTSAESCFVHARSLAEEAGDELEAARTSCALGHLRTYTGRSEEARGLLEAAIEPLSRSGDMLWLARTLEYLAFVTAQASDLDASLEHSRRQLGVAQRTGDRISACMAIEQTGMALWHRGDYDDAADALQRALREAEAAGYVRGTVLTANDLAGLWVERSDHLRAFRYVRRALEGARMMGYRHAIGVLVGNAGELYRLHGEPDRAVRYAASGFRTTAELHDWPDVTQKLTNVASSLLDAGRARDAMRSIQLADAFASATRDPYLGCEASLVMARILSSTGRRRKAADLAESSRRVAEDIGRRDVNVASTILALELGARRNADPIAVLEALRRPTAPQEESVILDVALWDLAEDENARRRAIRSLRRLVKRAPSSDNRRRLAALTDTDVSEPEPLPPLEDTDPPAPRLAGMFRDARRLLAEVAPPS